ncbi:hypothetical protein [Actinocatenispora rupis]|nr:hypothetical protein [Actinocatenispora rupis]
MAAIGLMAGAASFTHMHDWTMQKAPDGTPEWFGWANAVVSELTPALALLEWRRRRRMGGSVVYPVALLVGSGLLSLAAQISQAGDSWSSKGLAALPALAFTLLIKLVLSSLPTGQEEPHPVPHNETRTHPSTQENAPTTTATINPAPPVPAPAPAPVRPAVARVVAPSRPVTRVNGTEVSA